MLHRESSLKESTSSLVDVCHLGCTEKNAELSSSLNPCIEAGCTVGWSFHPPVQLRGYWRDDQGAPVIGAVFGIWRLLLQLLRPQGACWHVNQCKVDLLDDICEGFAIADTLFSCFPCFSSGLAEHRQIKHLCCWNWGSSTWSKMFIFNF